MHPAQIGICNEVFRPEEEELDWARKVVAAFACAANAARSILRVEGRMVERMHVAQAERILALGRAVALREDLGRIPRQAPLTGANILR